MPQTLSAGEGRGRRDATGIGPVTRRGFVKDAALALVTFGVVPRFLLRVADAAPGGSRPRVLVTIFQRGAADGLNIVVPHGDAAYARLRPRIGIPGPRAG